MMHSFFLVCVTDDAWTGVRNMFLMHALCTAATDPDSLPLLAPESYVLDAVWIPFHFCKLS
jgi:hypothetical protein